MFKLLKKNKKHVSTEWVASTLSLIDSFDKSQKEPREGVCYSLDMGNFIEWAVERESTFQELLFLYLDNKKIPYKDFYKAAHMDRKLFSAIKNNKYYQPKKETAVACCLGLKMKMIDAEQLLGKAGYKLSLSIQWDRIVYYCIKNKIYDIDEVNELLYARGEKCIFA